jgi:hypothetical protein
MILVVCHMVLKRGCLRTGCWGEYLDLKQEAEENYILRSFINCTLHQILLG